MSKQKSPMLRIGSFSLALIVLCSMQLPVMADRSVIHDTSEHTAFITDKSAWWTDEENFLAELSLSVNGTQVWEPLDVVICLDRSGSMDMNYIQTIGDEITGYSHSASCPCLNQDHFYLKALREDTEVPLDTSTDSVIENPDSGTISVYNEEDDKWYELDIAKKIHLYYEFAKEATSPSPMSLAPYHFKMEDDAYVRISKWDTANPRSGPKPGVWDHADENDGCYDRWMESKEAVAAVSEKILDAHPDNRVSLVPFSIRDYTLPDFVNSADYTHFKQWLDDNGYDYDAPYDSKVDWTNDASDITDKLALLFTTPATDYMYSLSMAYNMLQGRSNEEKEQRRGVVVFLSDGKPAGAVRLGTTIYAFANVEEHLDFMASAIKSDGEVRSQGPYNDLWNTTGTFVRHDIDESYWIREGGAPVGVQGLGAQMVTVSYMINEDASSNRLRAMASDADSFIEIPATSTGTTAGYLADRLLNSAIFPGGRHSVLRDQISKYYYIPDDATLPDGVTVEGTAAGSQTLVWDLGNIYDFEVDKTITVPLVLREEYRIVSQTTYYPTNADDPEPSLYTPDAGPNSPDTGAKLFYTDPADEAHYHTIGTPKLPVEPTDGPVTYRYRMILNYKKYVNDVLTVDDSIVGDIQSGSANQAITASEQDYTAHLDEIYAFIAQGSNASVTLAQPSHLYEIILNYELRVNEDTQPPPVEPPAPPVKPTTPPKTVTPDDRDPNDGSREFTPIGDQPVPLAQEPQLTDIIDGDIPLADLPRTGSRSMVSALALMGITALAVGRVVIRKRKYK